MATHGLLLLLLLQLASWAVHGYLPDKTYEDTPLKTCGRSFVRRAIYVCGSPKRPWKEQHSSASDNSLEDFFSDEEAPELDKVLGSSEHLALTTPPQAFYSGQPGVIRRRRDLPTSISRFCCKVGCTDSQIARFC